MPTNTPRPVPDFDVNARHAEILGKPLRIGPLTPEQFGKEGRETVTSLRAALNLPPIDEVPEYVAIMLRHPVLYMKHTELALALFKGTLPLRDRELAILRNSWLMKAPYEWGEHVDIGKRLGGLTPEEIERVTYGSTAPGWNEHDRAILRAVEETRADAMISDETWAVLARTWNEQQLIEFPLMLGQYTGIAYLQNSLRMRMLWENPGLTAR